MLGIRGEEGAGSQNQSLVDEDLDSFILSLSTVEITDSTYLQTQRSIINEGGMKDFHTKLDELSAEDKAAALNAATAVFKIMLPHILSLQETALSPLAISADIILLSKNTSPAREGHLPASPHHHRAIPSPVGCYARGSQQLAYVSPCDTQAQNQIRTAARPTDLTDPMGSFDREAI